MNKMHPDAKKMLGAARGALRPLLRGWRGVALAPAPGCCRRGVWAAAEEAEATALAALRGVEVAGTGGEDVVALGCVRELRFTPPAVPLEQLPPGARKQRGTLQFALDMGINGHPDAQSLVELAQEKVRDALQRASDSGEAQGVDAVDVRGWVAPSECFARRKTGTKSAGNEAGGSGGSSSGGGGGGGAGEDAAGSVLDQITSVVAVSSCKGGVGKSTVAVNLAMALARNGASVGLLDADIYGPSLPSLVVPPDTVVRKSEKGRQMIQPLDYHGVKCMSFGYVNPDAGVPGAGGVGAALIRGPIVSRVLTQLVSSTDWGDLDVLVVDMPPGTGDIQITLAQVVALAGAVVVTTPHKLAIADVIKGIEMFRATEVPTLSLVENMSYFDCPGGSRHFPFGKGAAERLARQFGIGGGVFQLPLSPDINESNEHAEPVVLREPRSPEALEFRALANSVLREVAKINWKRVQVPALVYDMRNHKIHVRYFTDTSAESFAVDPIEFRRRNPNNGDVLPEDASTEMQLAALREVDGEGKRKIIPTAFDVKGTYGVAINWSDGYYADIFNFAAIKRIVDECGSPS